MGYYYLGRLHAARRPSKQAEAMFSEALKRNPRSALVMTDLALVEEMQQRPERAAALYRKALASIRRSRRAHAAGLIAGRAEAARRGDQRVPRARADRGRPNRDPRQDRADLPREGRPRARLDRVDLVLSTDPDNARVRYYLGVVYSETGELTRARESLEGVGPAGTASTGRAAAARLSVAGRRQPGGSVRACQRGARRAARLDQHHRVPGLARARAQAAAGGDPFAKQLVEVDPNNDRYRFTLGALYNEADDTGRARADAQGDRDQSAERRRAQLPRLLARRGGKDLDEAESLIRRALAVDPNDGSTSTAWAGCTTSAATTRRRSRSWSARSRWSATIRPSPSTWPMPNPDRSRDRGPAALPRCAPALRGQRAARPPRGQADRSRARRERRRTPPLSRSLVTALVAGALLALAGCTPAARTRATSQSKWTPQVSAASCSTRSPSGARRSRGCAAPRACRSRCRSSARAPFRTIA